MGGRRVHALLVFGALTIAACRFDSSGIGRPVPLVDRPSGVEQPADLVAPKLDQLVDQRRSDAALDKPIATDQPKPDVPKTLDLPRTSDLPRIPDLPKTPDVPTTPDLPKLDLKKPDLPKKTCDQLYSAASSYFYCSDSLTSCTFYAATNGTCATLCNKLAGGTCSSATNASSSNKCGSSGGSTCTETHNDQKCTCSRP